MVLPEFSLRRRTHRCFSSRHGILMLSQWIVHVRNFDLSGAYVLVDNRLVTLVMPLLAEGALKVARDNEPRFCIGVAFDAPFVCRSDERIVGSLRGLWRG